jgi:hypothetical protein
MSKNLFLEMRAEQMANLYDSTFTKKEAVLQGVKLVNEILEQGLVDKMQFMASLVRLKAVIDTAENEMRNYLPIQKITVLGVEFTPVNGGNTINYSDDVIYVTIKKDLDARTEQLKMAQKQPTFDAYGNEVPKVSTTTRKSSITIKF